MSLIVKNTFMIEKEKQYVNTRKRHFKNGIRCKYFRYCQGNGMHLRDNEGKLLVCHLNRLTGNSANVPE